LDYIIMSLLIDRYHHQVPTISSFLSMRMPAGPAW